MLETVETLICANRSESQDVTDYKRIRMLVKMILSKHRLHRYTTATPISSQTQKAQESSDSMLRTSNRSARITPQTAEFPSIDQAKEHFGIHDGESVFECEGGSLNTSFTLHDLILALMTSPKGKLRAMKSQFGHKGPLEEAQQLVHLGPVPSQNLSMYLLLYQENPLFTSCIEILL